MDSYTFLCNKHLNGCNVMRYACVLRTYIIEKCTCVTYLSICLKRDMLTANHYFIIRFALEYPNEIIIPVVNDKWHT